MRATLVGAGAGETLRDILSRIGAPALAVFLAPGPGFAIRLASGQATIEPVTEPGTGTGLQFRVAGTGIHAAVAIEYSAALGTAIQTVTLTNTAPVPSPPIRELHAFSLPLEVRARHAPRACGFGGGSTHGYYPPRAYREEEVCFGEARRWEWDQPSFGRWITGRRSYILETEPGGRSASPNLCLMQTGWSPQPASTASSGSAAGAPAGEIGR